MQCHQVAGPFTDALGSLACALACAFTDIAAAPADITAGAWWLGWGCGSGLGGLGLRGGRLSLVRILAVSGQAESQRGQKQQCNRNSHNYLYRIRCRPVSAWLHFRLAYEESNGWKAEC
jgi:hypothetical protein